MLAGKLIINKNSIHNLLELTCASSGSTMSEP